MSFLTKEQLSFLRQHDLTEDDVFDGRRMKRSEYKEKARDLGKHIVLTTSPCKPHGHTLRTRHGNCFPCNPTGLVYHKRHREKQTLYIAGTQTGRCLKVGVTKDTWDRHRQMNDQSYGGYSDWEYLFKVTVAEAARVENNVLTRLSDFAVDGAYYKDGKDQIAKEMLQAPVSKVYETLAKAIFELDLDFDKSTAQKCGDWAKFNDL